MGRALSRQVEVEVSARLAELLDVSPAEVAAESGVARGERARREVDMIASVGGLTFIVECKAKGDAASVGRAARQVKKFAAEFKKDALPVVAVPFMGEVGRRLCDEAGVSWLDLSGNAHLFGRPGLKIRIEGKPNLFKRPGRPLSVFAPKSSRIARRLLIEPRRRFTQRELAQLNGLDEGFTSRIVKRMEEQGLISRDATGAVGVADFETMLEAWREAYDFSRHHIQHGHIAARSSEELLRKVAGGMKGNNAGYAATGLAGAWLLNKFAGFRLAVFYFEDFPSSEVKRRLGFQEVEQGGNVWLVAPDDEGVFQGASEHEGVRCVHPVQIYLDLKGHPERSNEAGDELRSLLLKQYADA